jgi:hypothetical protein
MVDKGIRCCDRQRVGRAGVEFSDEICYRLVCEIVTFGGSGIKGVNALMHTKGYSLILAGGDLLLLPFYCAVNMTKTSFNNSN